MSKYGVFSGPYFFVFGLNAEIYSVNFHIQSKYGKIWPRKNFVFGHFSHVRQMDKITKRFPSTIGRSLFQFSQVSFSDEGLTADYCFKGDNLSKSQNIYFPNLSNKHDVTMTSPGFTKQFFSLRKMNS